MPHSGLYAVITITNSQQLWVSELSTSPSEQKWRKLTNLIYLFSTGKIQERGDLLPSVVYPLVTPPCPMASLKPAVTYCHKTKPKS